MHINFVLAENAVQRLGHIIKNDSCAVIAGEFNVIGENRLAVEVADGHGNLVPGDIADEVQRQDVLKILIKIQFLQW